jgi:hypothetical protein
MLQMMGGRFRNVMPSDLFMPGALARGSLPAAGKEYASDTFRGELKILMRRCASILLKCAHGCVSSAPS